MRLIISGFHDRFTWDIVDKILTELPVTDCILTYHNGQFKVPNKVRAEYLSWENLVWQANYTNDWSRIKPLPQDILVKMSECETLTLKMMDRLETRRRYSYEERKMLYLRHLQYWHHVLTTTQVDAYICANIPHEIFDFILYSLCQIKHIPTIVLHAQSQVKDAAWIIDDLVQFVAEIPHQFSLLKQKYAHTPIEQIPLSPAFEREYRIQTIKGGQTTPFYMRHGPTWNYLKNVIETVKSNPIFLLRRTANRQFWANKWYEQKNYWPNFIIRWYYNRHVVQPDLTKPYLYFPLQFQPELSTSPLAGHFVDQILTIKTLSSSLPNNTLLYVKEHPMQRGISRSINYYADILSLPNVRLVSSKFDTLTLTEHSMAVATATGSVAWEALFRQKPVLLFGHYLFQYAPGVFQISSGEECQKAIHQIMSGKVKQPPQKIKLYVKAMDELSIPGTLDPDYRRVSALPPEKMVSEITKALIARIKQITSQST